MDLSEQVKEIRKITGFSQRQFSEYFKIPLRTVESWEVGKRTPPEYVVRLLERVVKEDFEKPDKGEDSN